MQNVHIVRWLAILSVVTLLLGPVIILMGAFSANAIFTGGALIIMGALGLYAAMKELAKNQPLAKE